MPKTFHKLENNQMIITFADLEGDYPFLQRSLALYKEAYEKAYPEKSLSDDDFTITVSKDRKEYIKYPENVVCINIGDLTDKSRSNTGRKECYNLKLVDIFSNTHNHYGDRMISILGNRETTKFRLQNELNNQFIQKVLHEELSLNEEERKKTGAARDPKLVWVDGPGQTFLNYIKSLPEYSNYSDRELGDFFAAMGEIEPNKIKILYAKWMLANSCGAPKLWEEIAIEAQSQDDETTLLIFEAYFCDTNSPYANYLRHCQLGAQVGNILFTHGGLEDNSFILPKTLLDILTRNQVKEIFGDEAIIAKNINQLLLALNTWYSRIVELHFNNPDNINIDEALSELIRMGLPKQRHNGSSLINVLFTDSNGAYGNQLNDESREKLNQSGTIDPVHYIYHGHMPAERPRVGTLINKIQGQELTLHHIDGDTCNYRKEKAAVATTFRKDNGLTFVEIDQIDEKDGLRNNVALLAKNNNGQLVDAHGQLVNESNPRFFLGHSVKLNESPEGKGWNIVDYNQEKNNFTLFKQGSVSPFKPDTLTVPAVEIYQLLGVTDKVNYAKTLTKQQQLFERQKEEVIETVNKVLLEFSTKSAQISHVLPEAQAEMKSLLSSLLDARDEYKQHLRTGIKGSERIGIVKANSIFLNKCQQAIENSLPILDRDLGWGPYLQNSMKNILNAVIQLGTFGKINNFFTPVISESTRIIADVESDLTFGSR